MRDHMEKASRAAETVYEMFLAEVVEEYVLKDREAVALSDKRRKEVFEKKTMIDHRAVRLMSISGKGGYTSDPGKKKIYGKFHNVTLLDHLLSVTRGAMVLSALDWAYQNPDIDVRVLEKRLFVVAVIGFMHDTDKDLQLPRNTPLETSDVEERMNRYGIGHFLGLRDVTLTAGQLRYLVEKVESTQSHRHAAEDLPPREFESFPNYVRLADQLDGAWLLDDPENGGMKGVLQCLKKDQGCLHGDVLKQWREIHLFDPHHPFLLDELQRWLSRFSLHLSGIPPLIEVHQDGHLFMLLPENQYNEIVKKSLTRLCNHLPFKLSLNVSDVGVPALYNGQPDHDELEDFVIHLEKQQLSKLFRIKKELVALIKEPLNDLLRDIGLQPRWPDKMTNQLVTLYSAFNNFQETDFEWLHRAAHLTLLTNLKIESKAKDGIPGYNERESELIDIVKEKRPVWISEIQDKESATRRTLTCLWITAQATEDEDVFEKVWGETEGILKRWLEGNDGKPGFNEYIKGEGAEITAGVKRRLQLILNGQLATVENEKEKGRCLFTDEPVPFGKRIDKALGLYGVNVSAFSGRDGRPELISSDIAHTNVGSASIAEHKLRTDAHAKQGGKKGGVPALVSSPTTSGLFGGLALKTDEAMGAMSLYDLNRLDVKKGSVLRGMEMYQGRHRMARLEMIPNQIGDRRTKGQIKKGQIDTICMILKASRRIGRPFHIFQGLPTLQKSYFYYDAMPSVLVELLDGNALCIEQIPAAIDQLETAQSLISSPGLGLEILKMYAMPGTRFAASCLAWCLLRDRDIDPKKISDLPRKLRKTFTTHMEDTSSMNEQDGALVRFGIAATGIQKNPGRQGSTSDELLVFKICLDTINEARRREIDDRTSLIHAVAGQLETNLVRKTKAAAREHRAGDSLMDGCLGVAGLFVNDVWFGVMKGHSPSQKSRQMMQSIYRVSFLKAQKDKKAKDKQE